MKIGAVIRGRYTEENLIAFGGRSQGVAFETPDPKLLLRDLAIQSPALLSDLYTLSLNDILDYLERLGAALDLDCNTHLQRALEAARETSSLTQPLIDSAYRKLPRFFDRRAITEVIDQCVGREYLEGWKATRLQDGRTVAVRAFGARSVHIIAGNSPITAALTIARNAITRGDAIIKSPSNDPHTALAIARTMIDMDPDHPLTRHISVAYWKGGDEAIEGRLYAPEVVEKIVAWGGLASVRHVTKYVQPGLELVTLDPKRSISIIGAEAFENEAVMREVALRLAADIGSNNQEGCVNARVVYVQSGSDTKGLAALNAFGQLVYQALQGLPSELSTPPKVYPRDLRAEVESARLNDDWYNVIGGAKGEGAIIVSQMPEPVTFAARLEARVANLVPIDRIDELYGAVDAYTQTVGVYPESLKLTLRERLPLHGAQRLTSLGFASNGALAAPQDAIEPLRRMCKWIVDESCDPAVLKPAWAAGGGAAAGAPALA